MKSKSSALIIIIPVITYTVSYLFLSAYHHSFWLFPCVIHEGGSLTLLQTIFYASHFLGHIPVHTVLALYYIGVWMSLRPPSIESQVSGTMYFYGVGIVVLLTVSCVISFLVFGCEDTLSFLFQQKQSMTVYQEGGSWILHFPSTVLLFFLIPLYLIFFRWCFSMPIMISKDGFKYIYLSLALTIMFMFLAGASWEQYFDLWFDPRYMAHSVRELATFPLTYFPFPLFLLLIAEKASCNVTSLTFSRAFWFVVMICFIVFAGGFIYQVVISLQAGVGKMAQKPAFAHEGTLSISYLLASHYFEHVLDTIYFFLFCGVLCVAFSHDRSLLKSLRLVSAKKVKHNRC